MVEIMRKERNVPFDVPADFTGPYPSADTCIMLDVAARARQILLHARRDPVMTRLQTL